MSTQMSGGPRVTIESNDESIPMIMANSHPVSSFESSHPISNDLNIQYQTGNYLPFNITQMIKS